MSTVTKGPGIQARRQRVSRVNRLASSLVLGYLRHSPFERGKWRLMRSAGLSLLVELEPGLFIRPLGLSNLEVGIIRNRMFEPETVRAFAALLAPGMTVFDLGASRGRTPGRADRQGARLRAHARTGSAHPQQP
jgi:hypothetical protein